eukprot:scaffold30804_cov691-Skeletonema_menzelii.AAC.1
MWTVQNQKLKVKFAMRAKAKKKGQVTSNVKVTVKKNALIMIDAMPMTTMTMFLSLSHLTRKNPSNNNIQTVCEKIHYCFLIQIQIVIVTVRMTSRVRNTR